jgi:hypothetical protein
MTSRTGGISATTWFCWLINEPAHVTWNTFIRPEGSGLFVFTTQEKALAWASAQDPARMEGFTLYKVAGDYLVRLLRDAALGGYQLVGCDPEGGRVRYDPIIAFLARVEEDES